MDELKVRVKDLMREIEFTHLKKNWAESIIQSGIDKRDAYKWVAEIGHVVDEYERSLRFLIDLLQVTDAQNVGDKLEGWIAYTQDMTVWKLQDSMQQLEGTYEKYLSPDDDDDEVS